MAYGDFRIEDLEENLGDLFSPNDPVIRTSGDVSFDSYDGASLHIIAGGSVNVLGNIRITGADENGLVESFTLSDGTFVEINGAENATLDIRAGTTAWNMPLDFETPPITGETDGFNPDPPNLVDSPSENPGEIVIGSIFNTRTDGQIFLTTMYFPNQSGEGNITITSTTRETIGFEDPVAGGDDSITAFGNDVNIIARGNIDLNSSAEIDTSAADTGGNILFSSGGDITTGFLRSLANNGHGGDIVVRAGNNIDIQRINSVFNDFNEQGGTFSGGNITLTSDEGRIVVNADINSRSIRGDAGDIVIRAAEEITVGGNISSRSAAAGTSEGDSGFVFLRSINSGVNVEDITSSSEDGSAGFVNIFAQRDVETGEINTSSNSFDITPDDFDFAVEGGGIFISSALGGISTGNLETATTGNNADSGSVTLIAENLIETRLISTSSSGNNGNSGNVNLTSRQSDIEISSGFDDGSSDEDFRSITTFSRSGEAGNVLLNSDNGEVDVFQEIRSSTESGELSGNVTINALQDVTTSGISTEVTSGDGESGDIAIVSELGNISNFSEGISSDADDGIAGEITLTADGDIRTTDVTSTADNGEGGDITFDSTAGIVDTTLFSIETGTVGRISSDAINGIAGNVILEAEGDITTADVITRVQVGDSGRITLRSNSGAISTVQGTLSSESTFSPDDSNADITLEAFNNIETGDIITEVDTGDSGNILLISQNGAIDTSLGFLSSETSSLLGDSTAGDIILTASDSITTGIITTQSFSGASGDILVSSFDGDINTVDGVLTSDAIQGDAGEVTLDAFGSIRTGDITTVVDTGSSGDITLTSNDGLIDTSSGILSSESFLNFDDSSTAGNIVLTAADAVTTGSITTRSIEGASGNILIESNGDIDTTQGSLSSKTEEGTAGSVTLDSPESIRTGNASASTGGAVRNCGGAHDSAAVRTECENCCQVPAAH